MVMSIYDAQLSSEHNLKSKYRPIVNQRGWQTPLSRNSQCFVESHTLSNCTSSLTGKWFPRMYRIKSGSQAGYCQNSTDTHKMIRGKVLTHTEREGHREVDIS